LAGMKKIFVVQVSEQEIMDAMILANRNGNIACTQGGESMAGLKKALQTGVVSHNEIAILDSTAHMLKFLGFQEMYFNDSFPAEFEVKPRAELKNAPVLIKPEKIDKFPAPGQPLEGKDLESYVKGMSDEIAQLLSLKKRS
jgi:threonine synthase